MRADLPDKNPPPRAQDASALNTALHSTSRWVLRRLRARRLLPTSPGAPVLEVGAINTQLLLTPDLRVRAVDLHSSHPSIERSDFFSLPHGGPADARTGACTPYDVVVCSMVLNCVPDPNRRFEMLVGLRSQLRVGGLAFITLPRSCLAHSRTLDRAAFCECLKSAGLAPASVEHDASDKVRRRTAGAPHLHHVYHVYLATRVNSARADRLLRVPGRGSRRRRSADLPARPSAAARKRVRFAPRRQVARRDLRRGPGWPPRLRRAGAPRVRIRGRSCATAQAGAAHRARVAGIAARSVKKECANHLCRRAKEAG